MFSQTLFANSANTNDIINQLIQTNEVLESKLSYDNKLLVNNKVDNLGTVYEKKKKYDDYIKTRLFPSNINIDLRNTQLQKLLYQFIILVNMNKKKKLVINIYRENPQIATDDDVKTMKLLIKTDPNIDIFKYNEYNVGKSNEEIKAKMGNDRKLLLDQIKYWPTKLIYKLGGILGIVASEMAGGDIYGNMVYGITFAYNLAKETINLLIRNAGDITTWLNNNIPFTALSAAVGSLFSNATWFINTGGETIVTLLSVTASVTVTALSLLQKGATILWAVGSFAVDNPILNFIYYIMPLGFSLLWNGTALSVGFQFMKLITRAMGMLGSAVNWPVDPETSAFFIGNLIFAIILGIVGFTPTVTYFLKAIGSVFVYQLIKKGLKKLCTSSSRIVKKLCKGLAQIIEKVIQLLKGDLTDFPELQGFIQQSAIDLAYPAKLQGATTYANRVSAHLDTVITSIPAQSVQINRIKHIISALLTPVGTGIGAIEQQTLVDLGLNINPLNDNDKIDTADAFISLLNVPPIISPPQKILLNNIGIKNVYINVITTPLQNPAIPAATPDIASDNTISIVAITLNNIAAIVAAGVQANAALVQANAALALANPALVQANAARTLALANPADPLAQAAVHAVAGPVQAAAAAAAAAVAAAAAAQAAVQAAGAAPAVAQTAVAQAATAQAAVVQAAAVEQAALQAVQAAQAAAGAAAGAAAAQAAAVQAAAAQAAAQNAAQVAAAQSVIDAAAAEQTAAAAQAAAAAQQTVAEQQAAAAVLVAQAAATAAQVFAQLPPVEKAAAQAAAQAANLQSLNTIAAHVAAAQTAQNLAGQAVVAAQAAIVAAQAAAQVAANGTLAQAQAATQSVTNAQASAAAAQTAAQATQTALTAAQAALTSAQAIVFNNKYYKQLGGEGWFSNEIIGRFNIENVVITLGDIFGKFESTPEIHDILPPAHDAQEEQIINTDQLKKTVVTTKARLDELQKEEVVKQLNYEIIMECKLTKVKKEQASELSKIAQENETNVNKLTREKIETEKSLSTLQQQLASINQQKSQAATELAAAQAKVVEQSKQIDELNLQLSQEKNAAVIKVIKDKLVDKQSSMTNAEERAKELFKSAEEATTQKSQLEQNIKTERLKNAKIQVILTAKQQELDTNKQELVRINDELKVLKASNTAKQQINKDLEEIKLEELNYNPDISSFEINKKKLIDSYKQIREHEITLLEYDMTIITLLNEIRDATPSYNLIEEENNVALNPFDQAITTNYKDHRIELAQNEAIIKALKEKLELLKTMKDKMKTDLKTLKTLRNDYISKYDAIISKHTQLLLDSSSIKDQMLTATHDTVLKIKQKYGIYLANKQELTQLITDISQIKIPDNDESGMELEPFDIDTIKETIEKEQTAQISLENENAKYARQRINQIRDRVMYGQLSKGFVWNQSIQLTMNNYIADLDVKTSAIIHPSSGKSQLEKTAIKTRQMKFNNLINLINTKFIIAVRKRQNKDYTGISVDDLGIDLTDSNLTPDDIIMLKTYAHTLVKDLDKEFITNVLGKQKVASWTLSTWVGSWSINDLIEKKYSYSNIVSQLIKLFNSIAIDNKHHIILIFKGIVDRATYNSAGAIVQVFKVIAGTDNTPTLDAYVNKFNEICQNLFGIKENATEEEEYNKLIKTYINIDNMPDKEYIAQQYLNIPSEAKYIIVSYLKVLFDYYTNITNRKYMKHSNQIDKNSWQAKYLKYKQKYYDLKQLI